LASGELEVLGRLDQQVKLRGFRIELGEIEAAMSDHADVAEAVVALCGDDPAEQRLVAYYVPRGEPAPEAAELRALLKKRLPDYMVPSTFMRLDAVPLTPNGKVDREALPEPEPSRPALGSSFVVPRTPTEQALAEIWAEVLGLDKIGIHDDFFDLGGHSLLAVRLVSKIEAKMGQSITLIELFQGRTIEHIARIVGEDHSGEPSSAFVAIQPNGSNPPVFAGGSHPRYVDIARRLGPNQPFYRLDVYGLQSERLVEGQKAYGRVEDMAAHFIEELRAVQPKGPYYLIGGCEGGLVAFEIALQLQRQEEQIAYLSVWVVQAPGHFTGPFQRQSALVRSLKHLRGLVRRGSVRGFGLREMLALIKHEYIEYRIFRASERYDPSEQYQGKLNVVRTAGHTPSDSEDLSMGWSKFGTEGAEVHIMPGDHQTWLEFHSDKFGDLLKTTLAAALEG
jgi:surfactin synthase thioesterase subunit/acyl carrier protein